MNEPERMRADLGAAMDGADGALDAADRLCRACVGLLDVDGASISVIHQGTTRGTFGSSGDVSRRLDELQFTFGEGPCLDAVAGTAPVFAPDLDDPDERRWPALRGALLTSGVSAVFALPVSVASTPVGALDLFRRQSGPLSRSAVSGGLLAAALAAVPLLDLMSSDVDWDSAAGGEAGWDQLASLERVEVYQATGMVMGALDISPAEALVWLRARAFAGGVTAGEIAWGIVERRVSLQGEDWQRGDGATRRSQ